MVGEEGCFFLRLEGGRRWEKSGLVQGWSGRGWGHALGCGQVSYGSWRCLGRCGGCNRIQPPGIVGTRTVIPALRAARCVLHSWERCREKRELVPGRWQNIHITPLGVTSLLPAVTPAPRWVGTSPSAGSELAATEGSKPPCLTLSHVEGFHEDLERWW